MSQGKTIIQWGREGRRVVKDSRAEHYITDDEQTTARGLFTADQTTSTDRDDPSDGWTNVITRDEWEEIKQAKRELKRGPLVKLRPSSVHGGVTLWCGPQKMIIKSLKSAGYSYQPDHYWHHSGKDPDQVATAFRAAGVRVDRLDQPLVVEGI